MFWISSEPSARGEEFHYDLGAVRPFETRASPIRLCRKRSFATSGRGPRRCSCLPAPGAGHRGPARSPTAPRRAGPGHSLAGHRVRTRRSRCRSAASHPAGCHSVVLCAVMNRRMCLASLVMPVLAGCSARAPVRSTPDRYVRRGLASWYGDAFDGKPTASGEPFDSNQFTTAHSKPNRSPQSRPRP